MHRVTYVERPALLNFGQDTRPLPAAEDRELTLNDVQLALATLQGENEALAAKLDQVLQLLTSQAAE